jgi:uncharacterized membrane protein
MCVAAYDHVAAEERAWRRQWDRGSIVKVNGETGPRRNSRSGVRVTVMVGVGVIVTVIAGFAWSWQYAPIVGWASACLVFVVWTWLIIARLDGLQTRERASREDPDRSTSDTLLLLASVASLVALFFVLTQAQSSSVSSKALLAALGVASVVLSWFFVHTLYTLRYAVLYYADSDEDEPVDFNHGQLPCYADFAYLSFTIGMTFQVSDTNIRSSEIRAAVLKHALLSYLFGAVILAAAVNLLAGLGS